MPKKDNPDDNFMGTARKRFQQAADDEREIRKEAALDLAFLAGEQWDPQLKAQREQAGRPAHVDNRLPTFVQQVSNEARQNKPQIKFNPKKEASKETAEVLEGLARTLQYDSDAEVAYETALEYGAGGSFGYYRILTDYEDDDSDEQVIKIMPVLDPFAVYGIIYPTCFGREPLHAFVTEDVPKDEYEELYPKSDIIDLGFEEAFRRAGDWVSKDLVRIAEYWYVKQELKENKSGSRKKLKNTVKFCKINGLEKLPDTDKEWPGYCIPYIPVLGKQIIRDGRPSLFSLIRFMRDPQKLLNYTQTRIAETLATAPISPFIGVEGQFAGHENEWKTINTVLRPYVEYKSADIAGKPAGPPQRQTFEPPIQSLSEFRAQLIDDQKAISGIFDASLGKQSNENSGVALQKRQQQSASTNLHFMDNLERAQKQGGHVIADLIPKIYDTERIIRILGEDETSKLVTINGPGQDEKGNKYHHKFEVGAYDVAVSVGRGWSTKRLETFDMMSQIVGGNPQILMMIGDIYFGNSDMAGSNQLQERFKKIIGMLHPGLVDDDQQQQIPPQVQAQLAQKTQEAQQLHAYAQQLEQEKQGKVIENQGRLQIEQAKAQTQLELERMKIEAQVTVAQITTKAQDAMQRLKLEYDLNTKLHVASHDAAHEVAMQNDQQAHEQGMAQQQAQIAAQQSEQGHQQALEQGEAGHEQALEQQDQAGQQAMEQQAAQPGE